MSELKTLYSLCFPHKDAEAELKDIASYEYKILDGVCFATYKIIAKDEAELYDVGTHPDHRNQGHAAKLILNLIDELTDKGIRWTYLEVAETNLPAIKLYEKCGFKKYGLRKDYYNVAGKRINAVLMKI